MAGPADRVEAPAPVAVAARGGDVRPADARAEPHEGDAGGQLPADQIEHPLEHDAVQPAAGPVAEAEGGGRAAAAVAVPEGGGGLPQAAGGQAGVLQGREMMCEASPIKKIINPNNNI